MALPGWLSRCRAVEMKSPSLISGIRIDTERVVVFPGDVQAPGEPHNVGGAVRLALFSCFFVPIRIPRISNPAAFRIKRKRVVLAFPRCNHSQSPVFRDNGYPIACDIDRRRRPRGGWRPTTGGSTLPGMGRRSYEKNKCGDCKSKDSILG